VKIWPHPPNDRANLLNDIDTVTDERIIDLHQSHHLRYVAFMKKVLPGLFNGKWQRADLSNEPTSPRFQ